MSSEKWKLDERSIESDYNDNEFVQSILNHVYSQNNQSKSIHSKDIKQKTDNKSIKSYSERLQLNASPSARLTYGYDAHMREQEAHWKRRGVVFQPISKSVMNERLHRNDDIGYHIGDSVKVFGRVRMIRPYSRVQKGHAMTLITPTTYNNLVEQDRPKRIIGPGSYNLPDPWKQSLNPVFGEVRATPEFRSQTPRIFYLSQSKKIIKSSPIISSQQQMPLIHKSHLKSSMNDDVRTISELPYSPVKDLPTINSNISRQKTANEKSKKLNKYYNYNHKPGFSFGRGPSLTDFKRSQTINIFPESSEISEDSMYISTNLRFNDDTTLNELSQISDNKFKSNLSTFTDDTNGEKLESSIKQSGHQLPTSRISSTAHLSTAKSFVYRSKANTQSFSIDNEIVRPGITSAKVADIVAIRRPSWISRWTHVSLNSNKLDSLGAVNSTFQTSSVDLSMSSEAFLSNESLE